MNSSLLLILIFLSINIFSLLMIWSSNLSNEIHPKFISSSYDPNATIVFDSMILKSINSLIAKYFKEPSIISKHVGDLPIGNNSYQSYILNETYHIFTTDLQSQYFLMFNFNKTQLRILQITSMNNTIALHTIPIDNFIIKNKSNYQMEKSVIKHCWSSLFVGKIIGAVASNDKNTIAFVYRIIKGNVINFRVRYIDGLDCKCNEGSNEKELFRRQDDILLKAYNEYYNHRDMKDDAIGIDNNTGEKLIKNYYDDKTYDDFSLNGNTPITAIAVQNNTIVYARDIDYHSFYLLKRAHINNNTSWSIAFQAISINKTIYNYYHTNALKFISDYNTTNTAKDYDFKLLHIYLTIDNASILLKCDTIKANYTSNTYLVRNILHKEINDKILSQSTNEFNLNNAINRLRKFIRPTVFSNTNTQGNIFEFLYGTVFYIGIDQARYIINSNSDVSVDKISSDSHFNENIIIKYHKGDLVYQHRKQNLSNKREDDYYYANSKIITFKAIPKNFRLRTMLDFIIDKFNERTVMIMLMDNGILISLDFDTIIEKENRRFWTMMLNEYHYTIIVIVFTNIILLLVYLKGFRNRRMISEVTQRRGEAINRLMAQLNRNEVRAVNNANEGIPLIENIPT